MVFLLILLIGSGSISPSAMQTARVEVGTSSTVLTWECSGIQPLEYLPDGLTGYSADDCGYCGSVLLPEAALYFAIPPGVEPELEIIPEGVHYLSGSTVSSVSVSPDGIDIFEAAAAEDIPRTWGLIAGTGTFRRAGYAHIQLHPVINRDGAFYSADRFRIRLSYPASRPAVSASGITGAIFSALFEGGNHIWSIPRERYDSSPFWGLPWYAMDIDTAGMYCITGTDIPYAAGTPSSSLSLFCGRGREMGTEPWLNEYIPRPVPILIEDGGDGTFDAGDRLFFFGRGLAWWEPGISPSDSLPSHFNHRFCTRNTYWLTWGGEDGARMNVQNGELTGAPAMPDSFLSRQHREQNLIRTRGIIDFPDDWAWIHSEGSSDTWHYFNFDAPCTRGSGLLKIKFISNLNNRHHIRISLNGTEVCDTTWLDTDEFLLTAPMEGILNSANSLSLQIIRDSGSDTVFLDWFEVFGWTDRSVPGQAHVPLDWWPVIARQEFTWENDLADALVFLIGGDTLAENISVENPNQFEFEVPASWETRELWISDYGDMRFPEDVRYESPGRIKGLMDGALCVYLAADEFYEDISPLTQLSPDVIAIAASEVYNEFNGGVRDPRAIQAMVSYIIHSWDPLPEDIILIGGGNWDPLNYISSRISYIDVLYRSNTSKTVVDDEFVRVEGSPFPQIALSRMGITNRSDLQLIVDRSLSYRSSENCGEWQTVVLGAADDEMSPLHGNDERYHTESVERLLTDHLPAVLRPEKLYLIFYPWNSVGAKPEAREAYISLWSEGALVSFYLGHGAYDQLADEGLLYLEDNGLLACEQRLPVALFGSCDVGQFQNPASECLAQQVTISQTGGAILGLGATDLTGGPLNEVFVGYILDYMFSEPDLSVAMCVMLAKIEAGNNSLDQYILFGDGSLRLAFPWDSFEVSDDTLFAGEEITLTGSAPSEGLIFVESWESCQPDTYITVRQHLPIDYLSVPGRFYSGTVYAQPDYDVSMFVPVDSDTGALARTQLTFISNDAFAAASTYPAMLAFGNPLPDNEGPSIELWIEGYRNTINPEISGDICVRAILEDSSGINLLGNVGRQLALYVDGTPDDVSGYFQYHTGSSTTGELGVGIGVLQPGSHVIQLRASDGLLNTTITDIDVSVTEDNSFGVNSVFPYPNPCSDGTSINWTQTSPGKVDISIYTVTGRRVILFGNIEGTAGYNQCLWDCRDTDGDAVASGTYIFIISAASLSDSGENSKANGIIAVVRNQ